MVRDKQDMTEACVIMLLAEGHGIIDAVCHPMKPPFLAIATGRDFVVSQETKDLAVGELVHRLMLSPDGRLQGRSSTAVLAQLLEGVPLSLV